MKTLIVVDMQNDFIDGALGSEAAQAVVPYVYSKIETFDTLGYNIIYTRDTHNEDAYLETQEGKNLPVKHCIINTPGWEIHKGLYREGYPIINKLSFGFYDWRDKIPEKYRILMEASDEIALVGLCTDICVISNAIILKALYPETEISVYANCCAGVTKESHERALLAMESCQIKIKS